MYFTDSHEWINVDGESGVVGITKHAAKEMGEVVFVQLPKVGERFEAGSEICVLESTKAAVDIYAPVVGTVTEINHQILENLSLLNQEPEEGGWLVCLKLENLNQVHNLLDQAAYLELVKS